jgi:hypothetical protein
MVVVVHPGPKFHGSHIRRGRVSWRSYTQGHNFRVVIHTGAQLYCGSTRRGTISLRQYTQVHSFVAVLHAGAQFHGGRTHGHSFMGGPVQVLGRTRRDTLSWGNQAHERAKSAPPRLRLQLSETAQEHLRITAAVGNEGRLRALGVAEFFETASRELKQLAGDFSAASERFRKFLAVSAGLQEARARKANGAHLYLEQRPGHAIAQLNVSPPYAFILLGLGLLARGLGRI